MQPEIHPIHRLPKPLRDRRSRVNNSCTLLVWLASTERRVWPREAFSHSWQGDKRTQQLVECQRALVRAFEGERVPS